MPLATEVHSSPWPAAGGAGRQLTTKHYRIYTTATDRVLLDCLPGFLEACHANYLRLSGLADLPTAEPMPVYLMRTRQEWAALTRSVIAGDPGPYLAIEAGGYFYRGKCVFWDMGGLATLSVAAHEGMHQFLWHRLRQHLPVWLEEGLCVQAEGYGLTDRSVAFLPLRNPFRFNDLRSAILEDRWNGLGKLLAMDVGEVITGRAERAVGYYGQLWALLAYMRSEPGFRRGMERMLADAQAGRMLQALGPASAGALAGHQAGRTYNRAISEALFGRYITENLHGFERGYLRFARKLVNL